MKFSYEIEGIGWADGTIEINGNEDYFTVSYLTNGLRDLAEGILSLLPECMPEDEVRKQVTFEWHAEPGGSQWNIEVVGEDQLHIVINSYTDIYVKLGGRLTLDEFCNKTDFIQCIVDEMANILKKYGLVGYRETWYEHDFPISAFLKLKNYLATGRGFPVEQLERYPGNEYAKSDLQKELLMLGLEGDSAPTPSPSKSNRWKLS